MKIIHFTPAVAMIELIFAIVIMGIVMMSAPMLMSTAQNSTTVVLQQEGVNQAVSRITMILSYPWDESDTNDSCIPPVLGVTNGDPELEMDADNRRIGVPKGTNSRTFLCGNSNDFNASATLGADGGDLDDIDDFMTTPANLTEIQNAGGRYIGKNAVSIVTAVSYGEDNASYSGTTISFVPAHGTGGTTNIKNIDVNVTTHAGDAELENSIVMHAFSCNIGDIAYVERPLP